MDVSLPKPLRMENGIALPGWFHSLPLTEPKKMPAAARTEVLPPPKGSHAKPARGETWVNGVLIMPRPMPLSPGNTSPNGTTEVLVEVSTVDCWPGTNDPVRLWESTGGVSMSQRRPRLAVK